MNKKYEKSVKRNLTVAEERTTNEFDVTRMKRHNASALRPLTSAERQVTAYLLLSEGRFARRLYLTLVTFLAVAKVKL